MPDFKLLEGDCREVLKTLPSDSIDAVVTDPPYELGFMGKSWDASGIAYDKTMWAEVFRVLKPGGHVLSFGGSRTYHRMAVAIEDAGFEVRDQIMWVYGSGFPKSHNISKAIDKKAGVERTEVIGKRSRNVKPFDDQNGWNENNTTGDYEYKAPATDDAKQWDGWGTALKPAHEPICLARKPLEGTVVDNIRKWGVGGLNIDGCRVEYSGNTDPRTFGGKWKTDKLAQNIYEGGYEGLELGVSPKGRFPANLMHDGSQQVIDLFPANAGAAAPVKSGHSGESNGIYNDYAQRGDDGATFYGDKGSAARFFYSPPSDEGRFPANLMHDGSQEVLDLFPESNGGAAPKKANTIKTLFQGGWNGIEREERIDFGSGSAARFFYCPKATKKDRDEGCDELETKEKPAHMRTGNGTGEASMESGWPATQRKNTHPTVKPTELMRYLCRLITPPGGTVLDPFNGSGSTGKAALKEGFSYVGIEKEAEYLRIAEARIRSSL